MSDKPILFSAPMVRALLAGTKTQTRRVPKILTQAYVANDNRQSDKPGLLPGMRYWNVSGTVGGRVMLEPDFLGLLPFRVGDRLYVREAFRGDQGYDSYAPRTWSHWPVHYEADGSTRPENEAGRLRPGIHMPRWASRLTLTVTDVRVERLQDISEEDAWAEGCKRGEPDDVGGFFPAEEPDPSGIGFRGWDNACDWYADLWDEINGPGSWDANPWVAAYTFTVGLHNIDAPNVRQIGDE